MKIWECWSVSKLRSLFQCPLHFYFKVVLKIDLHTIHHVFGTGIHRMAWRFFNYNFKSKKTFLGLWRHYWFKRLLEGEFAGKIVNATTEDFEKFFSIGWDMLAQFYEENLPYKDGRLPKPIVEKKFPKGFQFGGHQLTGVIDRIQPVEDGEQEIWDYKTGLSKPQKPELERDIQFTIYSLVFKEMYGKEPKAMRVIQLRTNRESKKFLVPRRTKKHYLQLLQWLDEARIYVENILAPPPTRWKDFPFRVLNPEDIARKQFSPRPGRHCNFCEVQEPCHIWLHKREDAFREYLLKKQLIPNTPPVNSTQLLLPL